MGILRTTCDSHIYVIEQTEAERDRLKAACDLVMQCHPRKTSAIGKALIAAGYSLEPTK